MDNEVVIFTSRQPQLIEDLLTKFTAETGIKVTVLSGNAQQFLWRELSLRDLQLKQIF